MITDKEYELVTEFGTYKIKLETGNYRNNGSLAIEMYSWDEDSEYYEPFETLTTNLPYASVPADKTSAYVDTDGYVDLLGFIRDNGIGEITDITEQSGFNTYVLVYFDI